jgi:rhodanese-related sulfurtransferase
MEVTVEEFVRMRAEGPPFELVDCRQPWEWELVRLPGARLIPLGEISDRASEVAGDKPVIVYCHHGVRSLQAAFILRGAGIPARSLAGGIDQYSLEADPTLPRY